MAKIVKSTGGKPEKVKLVTPVFRLSWPNLFEPRASEEGGPKKYGCSAIWTPAKFTPREKTLWLAILKELDRVSRAAFGKPWKELPDNIRRGLRDGAAKEGYEGYGPGTKFASLTSKYRPGVVGIQKGEDGKFLPISPEEGNEDEIYPGCYCRATVNVFTYTKKGKGIALGLQNLQKVKDGPRLDNRVRAEDDFDDDLDAEWLDQDDDLDTDDSSDADEDFD